jgi:hypothetical protein
VTNPPNESLGVVVVYNTAPPVVFRPNNVPCGPFRTWMELRSKKLVGAPEFASTSFT